MSIVNPVILNKQESLVFNAVTFSVQEKAKFSMFCELKSDFLCGDIHKIKFILNEFENCMISK